MGGCSAINCSNHSRKGFQMARLPKNEERRKKWIINMRRENWQPGPSAQICIVCKMLPEIQYKDPESVAEGESGVPTAETKRSSLVAATPTEDYAVRKRVLTYTNTKPTQKMVIEAIRIISNAEEKGASVPAIIKWIVGNYAILDMDRVKLHIKKAIAKTLQQGLIQRSAKSKGSLGTSGSFVLGNKMKADLRSPGRKSKKPAKVVPSKQRKETKTVEESAI